MTKNVDFNTLSRLHPVLAILVYLTATERLQNEDRRLSAELIDSPDWENLDSDSRQFVRMVDGANLSSAARASTLDLLQDYLPVNDE